jgi:autotransporter-associated beta strand protein
MNMKNVSALVCAMAMIIAPVTQGAPYIRQNTANNLNTSAAWGGGPPTSADSVQWDATCGANRSTVLGGNVDWGQIIITTPGGAITIGNTANATNTLYGLSGIGIDMSGASQDLTINNPVVLAGNQTWNVAASRTLTVGAYVISGAYGITKDGAGTLTLSGANTFSGGLTIKAGTVNGTTSASAFGTGTITLGDSSGSANATLSGGQITTYANPIVVAGGNTGVAAIATTAGNNSAFSGQVTLNNHDLLLAGHGVQWVTLSGYTTGTGNLIISPNVTMVNNGVIQLSGYFNNTGAISNSSTGLATTHLIPGVIGPNVTGLYQNSATAVLNLTGVNQLTGPTVITFGKITLGAQKALYKSPYTTTGMGGSVGLDVTGQTQPWLGGLSGNVNLASAFTAGYGSVTALTLNPQTGTSVSYGGVIANGSGATTLTKEGPGTQTFTAASTYAGATTVENGTLALSGAAGAIASTTVTARGGTLLLDNSGGTWVNRLADGTALSLGSLTLRSFNGAGTQSETVGATTFATSGKVTIDIGGGTDQTTLALTSVAARSAGAAIDFVGVGGTLGSGANSPNVTSGGAFPGTSNGILPWATVNGTSWAQDNANSIRAATGITYYDPTTTASDSTKNAQLNGVAGVSTLASAKAFSSFNAIASASGQSLNLAAGANLNLTSGAILKSGSDGYTISSGGGILGAGATGTGTELITHVDGGDLTISAPLNTAIMGIAKGGTGKLILSGTRAGTMNGASSIAGGQLEFQGLTTTFSGALSGPGGLTVNLTPGQIMTLSSGANTYSGPTVVQSGYAKLATGLSPRSNLQISNLGLAEIANGFVRTVGAGPDQFQITGSTCGIVPSGGGTVIQFGSTVVVWGSTYFNPTVLVLGDALTLRDASLVFNNLNDRIDLNGADRTIQDNKPISATSGWNNTIGYTIATTPFIINNTGTAGIIKTGTGELVIGGANTYNGATTINGGVLTVNNLANGGLASSIGLSSSAAGNLVLANGTTLKYLPNNGTGGGATSSDRSFTLNGTANGDFFTLDASGSGALNLTSTATPGYGTSGQTRTLILTGTYAAGNNTLAANLANNGGAAVSVTKTGAGLWVLSGANAYTGPTTLSAGTLSVSAANNLGNGAANLVFNGGTLQVTGTGLTTLSGLGRTIIANPGVSVGLDIASAGNTFTVDQAIMGSVNVVKSGAGTVIFSTNNTYTGSTTISGGVLQYNDGSTIPATPLLNNGALIINRTGTDTQGSTFHSTMYGTGTVTMANSGTLALNNINICSGVIKANAGTIALGHAQALQNSPIDTTGAGLFTLSGVTAPIIGGLTNSGTARNLATVVSSGYGSLASLTLNPSGTCTYGGSIAEGASGMTLTMAGSGTQVLQGANTYSGTTILKAGTLELNSSGSILNSAVTFSGGGLKLSNTSAETGSGRISDSAPITANGGTLTYNNTAGANLNYAETIGSVTLGSGQLNIVESVNQNNATANTQTLTLGGLTQSDAAAVTFSAATTGPQASGNKNMIVVSDGGTTTGGQIIGPWATVGTAANAQTDYAVYSGNYVVPAAIAATGEGNWLTAGNAYTVTNGATLGTTRTIAALRAIGVSQVLNLGGNSLQTYGVLNAGTALTITNGTLTTPGGGNLYVTAGSGAITSYAVIADNGGAVTLVNSGSGVHRLLGSNTFTGGTVLNAGTLWYTTDANLGAANSPITFNGSAGLSCGNNVGAITVILGNRPIIVNNGAMAGLYFNWANNSTTISNAISGTGGIIYGRDPVVTFSGGAGYNYAYLLSPSNSFTGPLTLGDYNGGTGALTINSLVDSTSPITLSAAGILIFGASAVAPLTVTTRPVYVQGSSTLQSDNTTKMMTVGSIAATTAGAKTLTLGGAGLGTVAGQITDGSGAISVYKSGSGIWTLSRTNNTYSGTTSTPSSSGVGGTLVVAKLANGGQPSSIGLSSSAAANLVFGYNFTLKYVGTGDSCDRQFTMSMQNDTDFCYLDASGTGPLYMTSTNAVAYGTANKAWVLNLTGNNADDNTLAASITNNGTSAITVKKDGNGKWRLSGANTFTGPFTMSGGGTLVLDYASPDSSKLSDTSALTLSGGTLTLKDGTHTEVVSSTTLNTAGTFLTRSGGSTGKLRLNVISRAVGGTIDFADAAIAETDTSNINSILGGWATLGNDWAVSAASAADTTITALPVGSYTGTLPSAAGGVNTANYTLTGPQNQTGSVLANTVKITGTGTDDTLALGANNLTTTYTSATSLGGILYAGGGNNNYNITGSGTIIPGTAAGELIMNVATGTLNVSTPIIGNGAGILTKTGAGTLVLNGASLYTGATYVNQGALRLGNAAAAGTTASPINIRNGAALELASGVNIGAKAVNSVGNGVSNGGALRSISGNNTYGGAFTVGTGGTRINADSGLLTLTNTITTALGSDLTVGGAGNVAISNVISGAGGLIKDGSGTLTLFANNTYTGATLINEGTLVGVVGGSCSNSAVTVASAGALGVSVTDNSKKWTCASLALNNGSQLKFNFTGTPSTSTAPLNILGSLTFSGTPTIVVSPINTAPGTYPLLTVGGVAPTALPTLSGVTGKLFWGGAGNKTLYVTIIPAGTIVTFR